MDMNLASTTWHLLRLRPLMAWGAGGILLGLAAAIHTQGLTTLNWEHIGIALLIPLILQGIAAHSLNDLFDFKADIKFRDHFKKTGRTKLLVSGDATKNEFTFIAILSITVSILLTAYLTIKLGYLIPLFAGIGLWGVFAYNTPPLKLGWKPLAEWSVVFPVLTTLVVAISYVATGTVTYTALLLGVIHALIGMVFFITSRIMDIEEDRKSGKNTTAVRYGATTAAGNEVLILILVMALSIIGVTHLNSTFFGISYIIAFITAILFSPFRGSEKHLAWCRHWQMMMCLLNAILILVYTLTIEGIKCL